MGNRTVTQALKSTLKRMICRIVYYSGIFHIYMRCVLSRRKAFPAVIINYHRFVESANDVLEVNSTVTHLVKDFKREILFLKRYFQVVPLEEVVETLKANGSFSKPTVAITVDDGYKDNFDYLFPALKENRITATIFLTSGVIGTSHKLWISRLEYSFLKTSQKQLHLNGIFGAQPFPIKTIQEKRQSFAEIIPKLKNIPNEQRDQYIRQIEEQLGTYQRRERFMLSWEEVIKMRQNGVHFGAHTVSHPILTQVSIEEAKREIRESKEAIESHLGIEVRHFAFPNGRPQDFSEELRAYCKEIGFESISSCDYGKNDRPEDIWNLRRIGSEVPLSLFAINLVRAFRG